MQNCRDIFQCQRVMRKAFAGRNVLLFKSHRLNRFAKKTEKPCLALVHKHDFGFSLLKEGS